MYRAKSSERWRCFRSKKPARRSRRHLEFGFFIAKNAGEYFKAAGLRLGFNQSLLRWFNRWAARGGLNRRVFRGLCMVEVGKTSLMENVIRAATAAGHRVAAVKLCGTGRMSDVRRYRQAGAVWTGDFVDFGFVSTYRLSEWELDTILEVLTENVAAGDSTILLCELGGDLLEAGAPHLIPRLATSGAHFIYVVSDALAAMAGLTILGCAGAGDVAVASLRQNAWSLARRLNRKDVFDVKDSSDVERLVNRMFA